MSEMQWIKTSERLPEEFQSVLLVNDLQDTYWVGHVLLDDEKYPALWRIEGRGLASIYDCNITHWCPITPPEAE